MSTAFSFTFDPEVSEQARAACKRKGVVCTDLRAGEHRCTCCGAVWLANIKPHSNGAYHRGARDCPTCGEK